MKYEFPSHEDIPVKGRLRKCLELISNNNLKGKTLVDVGCSNGWLEYKLQTYPLKKIIAIDPNRKAINFAKKKIDKFNFFVSDASKIPLNDSSADFVTIFDVIEHLPENSEKNTFKEISRILKKGGKLFLSTPNNHIVSNLFDPVWYLGHRHYKVKNISEMLEEIGFDVCEIEIVGKYWSVFYMFWFYIEKWIFRKFIPRNKFLEHKDDQEYQKKGFVTIFVKCTKR